MNNPKPHPLVTGLATVIIILAIAWQIGLFWITAAGAP